METERRWYRVGEDRLPTEADLPICWTRPSQGTNIVMQLTVVPALVAGDLWIPLLLPDLPDPEPEDEGIEVDGHRFRFKPNRPDLVEIFETSCDPGSWESWMTTDALRLRGKVAAALELIGGSPRLIELSPEQIAAAKRMAEQAGTVMVGPPQTISNDPQPLGDGPGWFGPVMVTSDREPQPTDGPDYHADLAAWAERNKSQLVCKSCGRPATEHGDSDHGPMSVCPAPPEPSTDGPWKVEQTPIDLGAPEWAVVAGNGTVPARCWRKADAIKIRDALNATPSDWPPMRKMEELADGHHPDVLIAYSVDGVFILAVNTYREDDYVRGRIGWWPLPPVPTTEET